MGSISGLLELTENEGWTVWISSHDIEEVERFADRVAVLDSGRVDVQEDVESLQSRFRSVELWFDEEVTLPTDLPATWLNPQAGGRTVRFTDADYHETSSNVLSERIFPGHLRHEARRMTLREVFVALARSYRNTKPN